jgi:ABC-2 type transport system permease protein
MSDILTVAWKETQEALHQRGGLAGNVLQIAVVFGLVGVWMPLQTGRAWLEQPFLALAWLWFPLFLAMNMAVDGFAGERERHTLETLLATPLPTRAILWGKLVTPTLYGWGLSLLLLLLGALVVNVATPAQGLSFYAGGFFWQTALLSLVASATLNLLAAHFSLYASSVRQAYQRSSLVLVGLGFASVVALQALPREVILGLLGNLLRTTLSSTTPLTVTLGPIEGMASLALLVVGAVAAWILVRRADREKLILAG